MMKISNVRTFSFSARFDRTDGMILGCIVSVDVLATEEYDDKPGTSGGFIGAPDRVEYTSGNPTFGDVFLYNPKEGDGFNTAVPSYRKVPTDHVSDTELEAIKTRAKIAAAVFDGRGPFYGYMRMEPEQ
jgi:hypothetical protein